MVIFINATITGEGFSRLCQTCFRDRMSPLVRKELKLVLEVYMYWLNIPLPKTYALEKKFSWKVARLFSISLELNGLEVDLLTVC